MSDRITGVHAARAIPNTRHLDNFHWNASVASAPSLSSLRERERIVKTRRRIVEAVNRGSLHFGSGVTRMERSNYRARQFPSRVNLWPRVNTRFVTRERRLGNESCDVDTTADTTAATPTWWNDARGEAPPNDNGRSSRRHPPSMATDRPN